MGLVILACQGSSGVSLLTGKGQSFQSRPSSSSLRGGCPAESEPPSCSPGLTSSPAGCGPAHHFRSGPRASHSAFSPKQDIWGRGPPATEAGGQLQPPGRPGWSSRAQSCRKMEALTRCCDTGSQPGHCLRLRPALNRGGVESTATGPTPSPRIPKPPFGRGSVQRTGPEERRELGLGEGERSGDWVPGGLLLLCDFGQTTSPLCS